MDAFAAWILMPLVLLACCMGLGLLAERLLRVELEGGLVLPFGFAAALVVLSVPYTLGLGAVPSTILLALPVAAGFVAGRARLTGSLPPVPLALAALAVYLLYLAPVVLSGAATFAGYGFLGDNSVHFSLVDHVSEHGAPLGNPPFSSYGAVLQLNLGNGYPLGPHFQLASLTTVLGTEVAWLYQPYMAVVIALAVLPGARLLTTAGVEPRLAALGGFTAAAGYLAFAYSLQGGAKELIMALLLLLGAVFAAELAAGRRSVGPAVTLGIVAAAAFTTYSAGGLPWVLAMTGAALALAVIRSPDRLRTLAVTGGVLAGVFALGAAASLGAAIDFFEPASRLLGSESEAGAGNLHEGLPPWEAFGIWLAGDYRFGSDYPAATYLLVAGAAALAVLGAVHCVRARAWGLLFAAGAALLVWLVLPAGIYIEAKLLMVLTPALVLLAFTGAVEIGRLAARPALGVTAAALLALAVVASDAMAIRDVYLAPKHRLEELDSLGERLEAGGPVLFAEFDEYGKHFLREADPFTAFDGYNPLPPQLREPGRMYATWADLDEMTLDYVRAFPLIVRRRNPVASRPPAPYGRVFSGEYYEVWLGPARLPGVVDHLPLGDDRDPTGSVDCAAVRGLARRGRSGTLVAALRPSPVMLDAADMERPPDWRIAPNGNVGGLGAGELRGSIEAPAGRYRVWVRGTFGRGVDVLVDGRPVGRADEVQTPEQMALVGETVLEDGSHELTLVRGGPGLSPGNGRDEGYDALFLEPVAPVELRRVPLERAESLCGQRADWIELVER